MIIKFPMWKKEKTEGQTIKELEKGAIKEAKIQIKAKKEGIVLTTNSVDKPCKKLGFCPYGSKLIKRFPKPSEFKGDDPSSKCKFFGNLCPVYFFAENITEDRLLFGKEEE